MKLQQFRKENRLSQADLAALVNEKTTGDNVSPSMIDRWEKGTIPRQENMRRIMEATGHEVTFADFYDDGLDATPAARRQLAARRA